MPKPVELTDAEKAARVLHEDQVSPLVKQAEDRLSRTRWALYYAKDRDLGVLQLLEAARLLRDPEAERKAQDDAVAMRRVFGEARTDREDAYRGLATQVAYYSGVPGIYERLELIEKARDDDDEYRALTKQFESDELPNLIKAWREERRATAEAMVQRVAALLDPKRKTLSMQALRDALNPPAEDGAE